MHSILTMTSYRHCDIPTCNFNQVYISFVINYTVKLGSYLQSMSFQFLTFVLTIIIQALYPHTIQHISYTIHLPASIPIAITSKVNLKKKQAPDSAWHVRHHNMSHLSTNLMHLNCRFDSRYTCIVLIYSPHVLSS